MILVTNFAGILYVLLKHFQLSSLSTHVLAFIAGSIPNKDRVFSVLIWIQKEGPIRPDPDPQYLTPHKSLVCSAMISRNDCGWMVG